MEDVNVLLVGLPGAGSSTLFKKLLELGDQSMYMDHSIALIERDTKRFCISELPSSYTYKPGLLKWGSLADIAVLIIPGSENIDNNWETLIHTVKCVCCIKALGIPKVVVAVNKIDNLSYSSYNKHQERGIGVCYNVHYRDEEGKSKKSIPICQKKKLSIPMSAKNGWNIETRMSQEKWSEHECLFEVLATMKGTSDRCKLTEDSLYAPYKVQTRYGDLLRFRDLLEVDALLDNDKAKATLWYKRAKIAGQLQLFTAFEAADKALGYGFFGDASRDKEIGDGGYNPFLYIMKGDQCFLAHDFEQAKNHYLRAKIFFKDQTWEKATTELETKIVAAALGQEEMRKEKMKSGKQQIKGKQDQNKKSTNAEKKEEMKEEDKEELVEKNEEKRELKNQQMEVSVPKENTQVLAYGNHKIEISLTTNFLLDPQEDDVYSGHKILNHLDIRVPICIIRCSPYQILSYEKLQTLADDGSNILSIYDISEFEIQRKSSLFFVVPTIKSVKYYYILKVNSLLKGNRSLNQQEQSEEEIQNILDKWWLFIQQKFLNIFRDIVNGLRFLSLKGHNCESSMYVVNDSKGKVLPSMNPSSRDGDFLDSLVKTMKSIVNQPCLGHGYALKWLPRDLIHLFKFISKEKLKHYPTWWVVDHFYFWSREERADFVIKLRGVLKFHCMSTFGGAFNRWMIRKGAKFFGDRIPDGILKEILSKGKDEEVGGHSSLESTTSDVQKSDSNLVSTSSDVQKSDSNLVSIGAYKTHFDAVRYMTAVYTHYNDLDYIHFRENKSLDKAGIEQVLSEFFPDILGDLFDTLYDYMKKMSSEDKKQVLKMLSRHYIEPVEKWR